MLTQEQGKKLLKLARLSVKEYFKKSKLKIRKTEFKEKQGVFVTIKSSEGELRGCIGYPYPEYPLGEAIQRAAISAAFKDPRFPPLTKSELDKVVFEISVLTKPELIEFKDPKECPKKIKIGEDGLIIKCGMNSGLLLPQVATDHEWDEEEFLQYTCYKAGLTPDMWMDKKTKIYKFQAQIFSEEKI